MKYGESKNKNVFFSYILQATTAGTEPFTSAEIISKWNDHLNACSMKEKASKTLLLETGSEHNNAPTTTDNNSVIEKQLEQLLRLSPEKVIVSGGSSTNNSNTDSALRAAILKQYQEVLVLNVYRG